MKNLAKLAIPILLMSGCLHETDDIHKPESHIFDIDITYKYYGKIGEDKVRCTGEDFTGLLLEIDKPNKTKIEYYDFNNKDKKELSFIKIISNNHTNGYWNNEKNKQIFKTGNAEFTNYLYQILDKKKLHHMKKYLISP